MRTARKRNEFKRMGIGNENLKWHSNGLQSREVSLELVEIFRTAILLKNLAREIRKLFPLLDFLSQTLSLSLVVDISSIRSIDQLRTKLVVVMRSIYDDDQQDGALL